MYFQPLFRVHAVDLAGEVLAGSAKFGRNRRFILLGMRPIKDTALCVAGELDVAEDWDRSSRAKAGIEPINSFWRDDSGQNLIEYALIAGLIGLGAVVAMTSLRSAVSSVFNKLGNVLSNAI